MESRSARLEGGVKGLLFAPNNFNDIYDSIGDARIDPTVPKSLVKAAIERSARSCENVWR